MWKWTIKCGNIVHENVVPSNIFVKKCVLVCAFVCVLNDFRMPLVLDSWKRGGLCAKTQIRVLSLLTVFANKKDDFRILNP